jgi:hypothetical protein
VSYYVAVSSVNAEGYSVAQYSVPQQLAPPEQKPSEPIEVYMVSQSSSALSVLWMAGESNGGATVGKYKIEWDFNSTFSSSLGSPVGSHHKVNSASQDCSQYHCSYVISGLEKGTPYYARVFAYNAYGYSQKAGIPLGIFESPKTQPSAPASVSLKALDLDAIQVTIMPPSDNGGATVTHYNIEWDVLDSAAYDSATTPSLSLLYSDYEVQSISTSDTAYGLSGYFYVSFDGIASGKIYVDATAEDMTLALAAIPSVGEVLVCRKELQDTFGYQWSITFLNSEWVGSSLYYNMPLLALSNVDGNQVSSFNTSVYTSTSSSTFTGTSGSVTAKQLVAAMSGFEQQSVTIQVASGIINGTFALSSGVLSTSQLDSAATAEEIRAALLLISIGDVVVRRRNMASGSGFVLYIIYTEKLGNNAELAVDVKSMVSSDSSATVVASFASGVSGNLPVLGSSYYNSTIVNVTNENVKYVYTIPDLFNGLHYYVRVSAYNGAGASYGASTNGYPILMQAVKVPTAVGDVVLTALSDDSLKVSWKEPTDSGGSPASSYLMEYDLFPSTNEVQVLNINASSSTLSGTFTLSFKGFSTSAIPYDASASRMEAAIESLASIGNVQVTRKLSQSGTSSFGISWIVTFMDNVGPLQVLAVSSNELVGSSVAIRAYRAIAGIAPKFTSGSVGIFQSPLGFVNLTKSLNVQTITVNASSTDLAGYFYVENGGEVSQAISVFSSAAEMKEYLESMLTITTIVDVTLMNNSLLTTAPLSNYGATWTITFQDAQYRSLLVSTGSSQATVVATGGSLTGSSTMVAVERVAPSEMLPTFAVISGLTLGQQYVARVTASNGPLSSSYGLSMVATAPRVTAPSAPLEVYMVVLSGSQIGVYWNTPTLTGGAAITGYSINWDLTMNFGGDSMAAFVPIGSGASSYIISGLTEGSAYTVRVAAYNSQGYSPFELALPQVGWAEVQVVTVSTSQVFTLTYNDGFNTETTASIPVQATALAVQEALQALNSIRSVLVSSEDQSSTYDATSSLTYQVSYRITFVDAGFPSSSYNIETLTTVTGASVVTVNQGTNPTSNYITTLQSTPSAPESVTISVVSNTELGVSWLAPKYNGGQTVTKFLVEWDYSQYFTRVNGSSYHAVVNSSAVATTNATSNSVRYIYQITGLNTSATYVRVSAFNGLSTMYGGYSKAATGTPVNSTALCNTMPILCSSLPASQILYLPVLPYVDISASQVANRLDINFTQPKVDAFGFNTQTVLPHTPIVASAYRIEYSAMKNFKNFKQLDITMILGDGLNESCHAGCSKTIGTEIQNVTIASGSEETIDGGSFALLYLGSQSQVSFVTLKS